MRIRIVQRVLFGEAYLFPGDVVDVEKKQAEKWIKAEVAINYPEEVTNGDGQNSTQME